jgi:hypothetical protein
MSRHRILLARSLRATAATAFLLAAPALVQATPYGATYYLSIAPNPPKVPSTDPPQTMLDGLKPGANLKVQVSVTNTGDLAWTATGKDPFRLSYHWAGTENIYEGVRTPLGQDLQPGQTAHLEADLLVPLTKGTYTLQWDIVQGESGWFSQMGIPTGDQIAGVGQPVGADVGGTEGEVLYNTEFCMWTDCTGAADKAVANTCLLPISSGPTSTLSPGSALSFTGCGFGTKKGKVILRLSGDGVEFPLDITQWSDKKIEAKVPSYIIKVHDQAGAVLIQGGKTPIEWPVSFRARRLIVPLPLKAVKVTECNDTADDNICNDVVRNDPEFGVAGLLGLQDWCNPGTHCSPGAGNSDLTIVGYHENSLHPSGDVGWDEYSATLKNGYTFHSLVTGFKNFDNDGSASNVTGFLKGTTSTDFSMQWSLDGDGAVIYFITLFAIGPAGLDPF